MTFRRTLAALAVATAALLAYMGVSPVEASPDGPAPSTMLAESAGCQDFIVKGSASTWYISDGIVARAVTTLEAAQLVYVGMACWDGNGPFALPQSLINSMTKLPRDRLLT